MEVKIKGLNKFVKVDIVSKLLDMKTKQVGVYER